MCRYGTTTYKPHYACFSCRKSFKRRLLRDINKGAGTPNREQTAKCPQCSELMADMGLDFEAPKMNDLKAWKHQESLFIAGITYHSCGCSGPGYIPINKQKLLEVLNNKVSFYVDQRQFWIHRVEPETQSEKQKDRSENLTYIFNVPNELDTGPRKNRRKDQKKAIQYWTDCINEVEQKIKDLEHT